MNLEREKGESLEGQGKEFGSWQENIPAYTLFTNPQMSIFGARGELKEEFNEWVKDHHFIKGLIDHKKEAYNWFFYFHLEPFTRTYLVRYCEAFWCIF